MASTSSIIQNLKLVFYSRLCSKYVLSAVLCVVVFACSQNLYVPSTENVETSSNIEALAQGRKLYIANCGSCHNLYKPEKFTVQHWTEKMPEMKVNAKISDENAELILNYLTSYNPGIGAENKS